MRRAFAFLLLAGLLVPAAPAAARPASCSRGMFVPPAQPQQFHSEDGAQQRADLARRVQAHLARAPQPYTGTSARAFLREGRADLFAAMELALHAAVSGGPDAAAAGRKAADILLAWSAATMDGDRLKVVVPKEAIAVRDDYPGLGLFTGLAAMGAAHAYHLLACGNVLSAAEDAQLKRWLAALAAAVMEGRARWERENYFGRQFANNHLTMHNAAIYLLGVALDDRRLTDWALSDNNNPRNHQRMLGLAIFDGREAVTAADDKTGSIPARGEIYDRYRMIEQNRGLYYAFFHLLGLTTLAEAAANQGVDLYNAKAETGESLADAALYYGEFLARHRCDAGQPPVVSDGPAGFGYYAGARVEAHFWTWIAPLLSRLRGRADIAALAQRVAATACKVSPRPYLPIPLLFLGPG